MLLGAEEVGATQVAPLESDATERGLTELNERRVAVAEDRLAVEFKEVGDAQARDPLDHPVGVPLKAAPDPAAREAEGDRRTRACMK